MGDVAATIKIMPESVDTDLDAIKEKIVEVLPEGAELYGSEIEPVAFGLKALKVVILVGDLEGGTESVEEAINNIDGVESLQVVELGRPV
ncbi:elongation factor 1-beta [Methanohalophilus sp.]|uniref:elongation factor 1-beta n=1 Tax=Methanohalophilus sp. TaxID=1966352 RepID=UPI00262C70B5|nr:elongation factor 1-beta [Methanohalophilus sp.]MDK2892252.1 elongation factor 1-beta [Methanohalophilus sp.]